MPERQPFMQKIDMRKVIDLSKLSLDKLKDLFEGARKKDKHRIDWAIGRRHYGFGTRMSASKKKKRNRRRNEIAKESRRDNR